MSTNTRRVVPARTEGLPEVTEVVFYHDRVTVCSAGQWVAILKNSAVLNLLHKMFANHNH
jgi:hypothetical protein